MYIVLRYFVRSLKIFILLSCFFSLFCSYWFIYSYYFSFAAILETQTCAKPLWNTFVEKIKPSHTKRLNGIIFIYLFIVFIHTLIFFLFVCLFLVYFLLWGSALNLIFVLEYQFLNYHKKSIRKGMHQKISGFKLMISFMTQISTWFYGKNM